MKRRPVLAIAVCVALLASVVVYAQMGGGGFTGPGGKTSARGVQAVTAEAAKSLADNTRVTLQGSIVRSLGDEKYIFRDASGEITVDIDDRVWRGVSASEKDRVEIYGEVDVEREGVEIDVKSITRLKS